MGKYNEDDTSDTYNDNAGHVSLTTTGDIAVGVGGGLAIDVETGGLAIDVGGIAIGLT